MNESNVIPSLFLDFMQMQEFAKAPLVFVEGKGTRLTTSDGQQFIDGLSGVSVTSLGHGNQAIIEAMTQQLRCLAFAPPLTVTAEEIDEMTSRLGDSIAAALPKLGFAGVAQRAGSRTAAP